MALEARGLRRRYPGGGGVDGLSLTVAAGELVGLVGPNGAGKSTAFRLIAGLEAAEEGTVLLGGVDVTAWPLHRRARGGLGYLPQGPSVLPGLTVAQTLAMVTADVPARLAEAGLAGLADRRADRLSGGERRRLELARALAARPAVLVLDEPFAGVDPAQVAELSARIRQIAAQGVAVLLTDHAVRDAFALCGRLALLDGGVVQITGTPAEIAADPRARARYLGDGFRWV